MSATWVILGFLVISLMDQVSVARGQMDLNSTELPIIYYTEPNYGTSSSGDDGGYKTYTEFPGGQITRGQRVLERSKSPYLLREDLYVERGGELVIEPGVEIRFAPMIGITVRGILTAKVSSHFHWLITIQEIQGKVKEFNLKWWKNVVNL